MPSTYSHYYFGQLVYQHLSSKHKTIIDHHRKLYDIGQNGPDVLLYHAPLKGSHIARQNHDIHMQPGKVFFKKAVYTNQSQEAHLAYLYGYLCHFVLDVYCHPYIESYKRKSLQSHMAIEREFECYLLKKNKLHPKTYSLTKHIYISCDIAKVMACYVDGANTKDILKTLFNMKCMYAFTRASSPLKRKLIYAWMDYIHKPYLKDFVFLEEGPIIFNESNQHLELLFQEAIKKAVDLIEDFHLDDPIFEEIFG